MYQHCPAPAQFAVLTSVPDLQVEVLHLNFHGLLAAFLFKTRDLLVTTRDLDVGLNIQSCSATLTELCLEGLLLADRLDRVEDYRHAQGQRLKVTAYLWHF